MKIRPLIGITYADNALRDNEMRIRTYVSRKYYQALQTAGADVIMLPPTDSDKTIERYLNLVDGLLLPGGEDVDPRYQGEDPHPMLGAVNPFRDDYEIKIASLAYEIKKPVLGICRGIQLMCIAMGGAVYQDISQIASMQHFQKAPRWATSHRVVLSESSRLATWIGNTELFTNSFHHQAIRNLPSELLATGTTSDEIIESIEADERIFVGVQWHPEETLSSDEASQRLFKGFVGAVAALCK